jgi:hypothetical protein
MPENKSQKGVGLIAFKSVKEGLEAETILKNEGYAVRVTLPPENLIKGCDLAIEFDTVEQLGIERVLKDNKIDYLDILSVDVGTGVRPIDIIKTVDYGDSIMVRAAQMKITFDKETGVILNISGGGCPDVPYLYMQLIDKKLTEAPHPKRIGYTLCGMMLDRAFEEALRIYTELQVKKC